MIGLLGNACVVVVYKLKFKRSSARVYIISLALADMSVCLVGLPYHIIDLTVYSESIDDSDENADDECVAKIEAVHVETQLLPSYNDTDNDLKAASVTSARSVESRATDTNVGQQ
ncbi:hypothetical protein DPMN_069016 [Dreissena polymorpha]|uniref:G-protein coupled receptors family 1 profile domain-containing protein n=1 Tax=Dreissena polymorpha TaxID=45954 RepID=A0A9D3Z0A7_DREPO|nr:hypothetical protein DPMN_069016 [Dreissena polymorpha]